MCKKRDECRALIALLHHQSSPDHADEPGKGDRSFVGHVDLRDRDGYGLAGPTWKEPKRRRGIWSGLLDRNYTPSTIRNSAARETWDWRRFGMG